MKRAMFLVSVACVVLVCIAAASLVSSTAYATSDASLSITIHNSDPDMTTATDLHFYLTTYENKWFAPYPLPYVCFLVYSVTTDPGLGVTPTFTEKVDGAGCVYGVEVDYEDISVPYCTTVGIDIKATLSKWNSLVVDNLRFTYPSRPPKKASPSFGFTFKPLYPIRVKTGVPHQTTLTFANIDSTDSLTLRNVRVFHDTVWVAPGGWTDSVGTPIYVEPGPIGLGPGDFSDIILEVPTPVTPRNDPPSYIYAYAEKEDADTTGFVQVGHEETLVLEERLPSLGTWGILLLALALATTVVLLIRRRRALPTQ